MLSTEQISEMKAKHGPLRMLKADGNSVIVRRASETEWAVYLGHSANDSQRLGAMRHLLDKVVVHPAQSEFSAMVANAPGLVQTFGIQATEFSGFLDAKSVEKTDL
jgi:hypothetical protein